jgi:hypothetical protein
VLGQALSSIVSPNSRGRWYVYSRETPEAATAHVLTEDQARRIASNIAKLPQLLSDK